MNVLRLQRLEHGMSQLRLSIKSGVWQSRISAFENELFSPSAKEKRRLAKALGVAEDAIFPLGEPAKK
jgi:transcriptional regulator with XRE-family HTH domain